MDTKQKKFKYSRGSRVLVCLLSLFFSVVFIFNLFDVFMAANYFGIRVLSNEATVFDLDTFYYTTMHELDNINYELGANANKAKYEKNYDKIVSNINDLYKIGCEAAANFEEVKTEYAEQADLYYEYAEYTYSIYNDTGDFLDWYGETDTGIYNYIQKQGDEDRFWGYVFEEYFTSYYYDSSAFSKDSSLLDLSVDCDGEYYAKLYSRKDYYGETGRVSLTGKLYFTSDFDVGGYIDSAAGNIETVLSDVYSESTLQSSKAELAALSNVKYYAKASDGSVSTNVKSKEVINQLIENSTDSDIAYYVYMPEASGGNYANLTKYYYSEVSYTSGSYVQYAYSSNFSSYLSQKLTSWLESNDSTLYLVFDDLSFSGDDVFQQCFELYSQLMADVNIGGLFGCLSLTVISFIAMAALFIYSLRLAGHKGGEVVCLPVDKVPWDIHFVLSGCCIGLLVTALILLWISSYENYGTAYNSSDYYLNEFIHSDWFGISIAAAAGAINLFFTEVFTSLARQIKTKRRFLKYFLLPLFVRLLVELFKLIRKAGKKTRQGLYQLAFRYKYVSKWSTAGLALLVLLSLVLAVIGGAFLFDEPAVFFFFIILSLIPFGLMLYFANRFLRQLDSIVKSFDTAEPVRADVNKMPRSLKILATSYEENSRRLAEAVSEAVKSEQMKSELITNVSHDLKTPLTSIINYSDLLQQLDISDETGRQYVQVIAEKSNRLKKLIEDLIEVSKVTTGNVTLNKTALNLNELTAQAMAEEAADFDKYGLELVFDNSQTDSTVWADGAKVYRIYQNLLSNAKKYSAPGSRVYARIYSGENFSCFEIKNISKTPLNISPDKLLERFVRADKARSEEGNGLGLSIAQELCALNGGELAITIDGDLFKATVKLPKYKPGIDFPNAQ